jgi:tripartite-type tricarboxylate transporter receptor subunit TctC
VIDSLAKKIQMSVNDPVTAEHLRKMGLEPIGSSPEAFAAFIKFESSKWQAIVKKQNIKVD